MYPTPSTPQRGRMKNSCQRHPCGKYTNSKSQFSNKSLPKASLRENDRFISSSLHLFGLSTPQRCQVRLRRTLTGLPSLRLSSAIASLTFFVRHSPGLPGRRRIDPFDFLTFSTFFVRRSLLDRRSYCEGGWRRRINSSTFQLFNLSTFLLSLSRLGYSGGLSCCRIKGNRVRIPDSTRCCDLRKDLRAIRPLPVFQRWEGARRWSKSEDLP